MFREMIKNSSPSVIKRQYRCSQFILIALLLGMVIGVFQLISKGYDWAGYFLIVMMYVVNGCYFGYLVFLGKSIRQMTTENLKPVQTMGSLSAIKNKQNARTRVDFAYLHLLAGHFEASAESLGSIDGSQLKKQFLKDSYSYYVYVRSLLEVVQGHTIDLSQAISEIESVSSKNRKVQEQNQARIKTLQAISDIEAGTANSYFDTATIRHKLDRVICRFYQGKNELLLGNLEKAREWFADVAQENDEVYFVREARKLLAEMD